MIKEKTRQLISSSLIQTENIYTLATIINKVIDDGTNDLLYFFTRATIQVGDYFTALFEGLACGLDTFISPLHGYIYMENLIDVEKVQLVNSAEELFNKMSKSGKT